MTVDELWQAIRAAGREHDYVLNRVPRAPGAGLPSSAIVVEPAADGSGRWVRYATDRGEIISPRYFRSESAACLHVRRELTEPSPARHVMTEAERQQAAEIAEDTEARRRELIRAAGYDPDTRQPLPPPAGQPPQ